MVISDRVPGVPSLEERMDDVSAIMQAIGSKRAALVGVGTQQTGRWGNLKTGPPGWSVTNSFPPNHTVPHSATTAN